MDNISHHQKVNKRSDNQGTRSLLGKPEFHYDAHMTVPTVPFHNQINPGYNILHYFLKNSF
jgi:hypothetical protein